MNKVGRLTEAQIEQLALEIREFLLEHDMWVDTDIFFNGKMFTQKGSDGSWHYNDHENLFCYDGKDPRDYFEYENPDHILSMSFEGPVCHMIYYGEAPGLLKKFDAIFRKYGLYYELGNHWNLSCYYI